MGAMLTNRLLKKSIFPGCSKMPLPAPRLRQAGRCKAPEILRSEAYLMYTAMTKDEGNAADGRF